MFLGDLDKHFVFLIPKYVDMIGLTISNLMTTVQTADFSKLLNGKGYAVVSGQIIFERDGQFYITTIEDDRNDFTVEDYMLLPEGAPFELLNGKLHYMPSPFRKHQIISMNLSAALHFYARKNKLGQVLAAPMDVHFGEKNVVQPDIIFVSNSRKNILQKYVEGAPDFLVEILSVGTTKKDLGEKKELYEKMGVLEYWVIDPHEETVEVFNNKNNKMVASKKYQKNDSIQSLAVKGFEMSVAAIFEE